MIIAGIAVPKWASLVVWCVLWEIAGRTDLIFLLPPLSAVVASGVTLVQTASWQAATVTTAYTFLCGMALAIVIGVPAGVMMGRSKVVDDLLGLWVNLFASAPLSALVPVLMILLGLGETTVIVSVFLFAVWIIMLDARAGVLHVPASLVEMGKSYGASRVALYGKIIVWAALPEILAGIRLGLIRGVKGVVVGQLLVSIIGYGALFETFSRSFEMESFWALTLLLFGMAMILTALIESVEKRVEYYAGARA